MSSAHDLSKLTILVVDDDRDSRALLTAMLSFEHSVVVPVATVAEALRALTSARFDLLISDIGLRGRSGYELIRIVRNLDPPTSRIPAIAVTGFTMHSDRILVRAAGFQAHVSKPVDRQDLLSTIRSVTSCQNEPPESGGAAASSES